MRPANTPPATEPGRTASGLTRRVPGAHLPTTGPVAIRRAEDPGATPPRSRPSAADIPPAPRIPGPLPPPIAPPAGGGPTPGQERAESVYTLLTSFAVGVQRGLDEAATTDGPPNPT
jgi:hypothetical protein